jgi:hypothetical protein
LEQTAKLGLPEKSGVGSSRREEIQFSGLVYQTRADFVMPRQVKPKNWFKEELR